ncbi:hypothetical protein COO60DRAFT_1644543 [Scenedesmus sp. NREL 46B-D3]|nr:hypothetical protein COO60DRAFT_1644543 [Scenedesmus sp. NREL 46B-D3]
MASEEELQRAKAKLAALNAINSALTKENEELRDQLEDLRDQLDHASEPKSTSEAEAFELKEEFARRLGEQQRTIDILKDTNQKLQAKVKMQLQAVTPQRRS